MVLELYSVGCGHDYRLGLPKGEVNKPIPTKISFFDENDIEVKNIWSGGSHNMVLTNKGLYSFGYNAEGQLGVGVFGPVGKPQQLRHFDNPERVKDVSLGGYHSIVISDRGELFSFGSNKDGQIGNSSDDNCKNPTEVSLPPVLKASAGSHHTIAWTISGIYTWGQGSSGQLGYTGDAWDILLNKQNRIKSEIVQQAKFQLSAQDETNGTMEPYNSCHHPEKSKADSQKTLFFEPFCQRSPRLIDLASLGIEEVLDVRAGYNHSVIVTINGIYAFGARPGQVRERVSDSVPTLVALPGLSKEIVLQQFISLKDAHIAVWIDNDKQKVRIATAPGEWDELILPSDGENYFQFHGTESSVFLQSAEGMLFSMGDNYFGQLGLGHDNNSDYDDPMRWMPNEVLQPHNSTLCKVSVGWRHVILAVKPKDSEE